MSACKEVPSDSALDVAGGFHAGPTVRAGCEELDAALESTIGPDLGRHADIARVQEPRDEAGYLTSCPVLLSYRRLFNEH